MSIDIVVQNKCRLSEEQLDNEKNMVLPGGTRNISSIVFGINPWIQQPWQNLILATGIKPK
jgi:hypothetical protein